MCNSEEEQKTLAQISQGDRMELDDAFAEIAGVDKATLLQRAAEHKWKSDQTGLR